MKKIVFIALIAFTALFLNGCGFLGLFGGGRETELTSGSDVSSERITLYILSKNKKLSVATAKDMANTIIQECRSKGLNPLIVTALINKESSFRPDAVSSSNAKGLGQLKDATAKSVGVDDPFDYKQNIAGLCRYLRMLYNNYDDRADAMELTLASYRMGPTYIKNTVIKNHSPLPGTAVTYIEKIKHEASQI